MIKKPEVLHFAFHYPEFYSGSTVHVLYLTVSTCPAAGQDLQDTPCPAEINLTNLMAIQLLWDLHNYRIT